MALIFPPNPAVYLPEKGIETVGGGQSKGKRACRIRKRLGDSPDIFAPFPPKPKRMHWKTYFRMEEKAEEAIIAIPYPIVANWGFSRWRKIS